MGSWENVRRLFHQWALLLFGHLYPVSGEGVHSGALFSLPFLKDAAGIIKKN